MTDNELDGFLEESAGAAPAAVNDSDLDSFLETKEGSIDAYDVSRITELEKKRDALPKWTTGGQSIVGAAMVPNEERATVEDQIAALKENKLDDEMRSFAFRGGSLKDGEVFEDGNGEAFAFDYEKMKRGEDPRIPISMGEYLSITGKDDGWHSGPEDERDVKRLKASKADADAEESRKKGNHAASKYLEERFGKVKGRVDVPAEFLPAYVDPEDNETKAELERLNAVEGKNIRHTDRPMHVNRDENGKIVGYSTTSSTVIPENDTLFSPDGKGHYSVIPTIRGKQGHTVRMTEDEAKEYYRLHSGEKYGTFASKEEAEKAVQDIHNLHQKIYQPRWNQYINEHWDEVSDEIKNDPGVAAAHMKWIEAGSPMNGYDAEGERERIRLAEEDARAAQKKRKEELEFRNKRGTLNDAEKDELMWLNGEKKERTIGQDIRWSLQSETGDRNDSTAHAVAAYMLPGYKDVLTDRARADQTRYERYLDGDYTEDDLKVDTDLAAIVHNTVGGKEAKKDAVRHYGYEMLANVNRVKDEAKSSLQNTELAWYKKPVTGGVQNTGYTLNFALSEMMLGGVGGLLVPAATAAHERYGVLTSNEYGFGDNGELVISELADSSTAAGAKAIVGGLAEAAVERYLEVLGAPVAKSALVKTIRGKVMRKLAEASVSGNKVARVIPNIVRGYGKIGKYTGVNSAPWEVLEEDAQAILDEVIGIDNRRDSRVGVLNGSSAAEAWSGSDQLSWKGQLDVFLSMLGTMAFQAGVGGVIDHYVNKGARNKLKKHAETIYDLPIDRKYADAMSDREKAKFISIYNQFGDNPDKLVEAADRMFGKNGILDIALRNVQARGNAEAAGALSEVGVQPAKFTIPTNEKGEVAFTPQVIFDSSTGKRIDGKMALDDVNNIGIVDCGDGRFIVVDFASGLQISYDNLQDATNGADQVLLARQVAAKQAEMGVAPAETPTNSEESQAPLQSDENGATIAPSVDGIMSRPEGADAPRGEESPNLAAKQAELKKRLENGEVDTPEVRKLISEIAALQNTENVVKKVKTPNGELTIRQEQTDEGETYYRAYDANGEDVASFFTMDEMDGWLKENGGVSDSFAKASSPVESEKPKKALAGVAKQMADAKRAEKKMRGKFVESEPVATQEFSHWNSRGGSLLNEPPSKIVRNRNGKGTHKEYYGDPAAEAINQALDGIKGRERERIENLLFGSKKSRVPTSRGGNDTLLDNFISSTGGDVKSDERTNDYAGFISRFLDQHAKYAEFRDRGGVTSEEIAEQERYEAARANEVDINGDYYDIDEIEQNGIADEVYDSAVAEVEKFGDDSGEVLQFSREGLRNLKPNDTIRFDHDDVSWIVEGYDDANGEIVVTNADVADNPLFSEEEKDEMSHLRFRITENGWLQLKENGNGIESKTGEVADNDVSGDAKGESGGRGENLVLESATQDQLNAEERKRREQAEIKRRQSAPLKGGSGETGQSLLDLGGAEGEDLFNRTERKENVGDERKKPEQQRIRESDSNRGEGQISESDIEAALRYDQLAQNSPDRKKAEKALSRGIPVSRIKPQSLREDDGSSIDITKLKCEDAKDCAQLFQYFYTTKGERTKVVYLGKNGEVLGIHVSELGKPGSTSNLGSYIFSHIPDGCVKIVIGHNHPGGNPSPSSFDRSGYAKIGAECTKRGIKFDGIITDGDRYCAASGDYKIVKARLVDGTHGVFSNNGTTIDKLVTSYLLSPTLKRHSWLVGIDAQNRIVSVVQIPADGNMTNLLKQMPTARSYAIACGEDKFDRKRLIQTIDAHAGKSNARDVNANGERRSDADFFYIEDVATGRNTNELGANPMSPDFRDAVRDWFIGLDTKKAKPAASQKADATSEVANSPNLSFMRIKDGGNIVIYGRGTFDAKDKIKALGATQWRIGKKFVGWVLDRSQVADGTALANAADKNVVDADKAIEIVNGKKADDAEQRKAERAAERAKAKEDSEREKFQKRADEAVSDDEARKEAEDIDFAEPKEFGNDEVEVTSAERERNAIKQGGRNLEWSAELTGVAGSVGDRPNRDSAQELLSASRRESANLGGVEADRRGYATQPFADGARMKGGTESPYVYRSADGTKVRKYRSTHGGTMSKAVMKIADHNALFGDKTPYTVVGIAEGNLGPMFVLEQPYVEFEPNSGDRAKELLKADMERRFGEAHWEDGELRVGNGEYAIDDLKDLNIGIDKATGDYAVIDALVYREKKYGQSFFEPKTADESPAAKREAFGRKRVNDFLCAKNEDGSYAHADPSFAAFAKWMDGLLGAKAEQARRFYASWYTAGSVDAPTDRTLTDSAQVAREHNAMMGLAPRGQDRIGARVANVVQEGLMPKPPVVVDAQSYDGGLDADQQLGVNLALNALKDGNFILADDTGFGKTRQILAIADQFKKANKGANVLILTENEQILAGSFADDSRTMGVNLSDFTTGTYTGLGDGKFDGQKLDLVILDEAHNVANVLSARGGNFAKMDAAHVVFSTATPMDKPTDADYFISRVLGIPRETVADMIGFRYVDGKYGVYPVPMEGMDENMMLRNLVALRNRMIADGRYVRREYPFLGSFEERQANLSQQHAAAESSSNDYWDHMADRKVISRYPFVQRIEDEDERDRMIEQIRKAALQQKVKNADVLNEHYMAQEAAKEAIAELAKNPNAAVVVVGEQVNDRFLTGAKPGSKIQMDVPLRPSGTDGKGRTLYRVEGSLPLVIKEFEKAGHGNKIAKLFGANKKAKTQAIADFNNGTKNILVMTKKSGGTGVNLDDRFGNRPRIVFLLSPEYSAKVAHQLQGRFSRKPTQSDTRMVMFANPSYSYAHRNRVAGAKVAALNAITSGADSAIVEGREAIGNEEFFETKELYTGSAADYEKPSLLKVGTGEGSQVYGWGLYASSERGVAETYANMSKADPTSPALRVKVDGKYLSPSEVSKLPMDMYKAIAAVSEAKGNINAARKRLAKSKEGPFWKKSGAERLLESHSFEYAPKSSVLYEQTFFTDRAPGDESHLLKWYEPVSEENKKRVADQLNKEYGEKGFTWKWNGDSLDFASDKFSHLSNRHKAGSAADLYARITTIVGGKPKAASEFLARADIDGIKYPVDSYGGKTVKDGDTAGWNYVSFRDDNIRVDHKWVDGVQLFEPKDFPVDVATDRLNNRLANLFVLDPQFASDVETLRKTAEKSIKNGADDTPSESEARYLREKINEYNSNAREAKKKAADDPSMREYWAQQEKAFRDYARDYREQLKALEKDGIGDDDDQVDWYRNADFLEMLDAIESGEASNSAHFDPNEIYRGSEGPFAYALNGMRESSLFKGKDAERFERVAKKINVAYREIESDIENPRGPFGEMLYEPKTDPLARRVSAQAVFDYARENNDPSVVENVIEANLRELGFFEPKESFFDNIAETFGTTEDIGDALLVTPEGRMISSQNGFVGHNAIGELVLKDNVSLGDRLADQMGEDAYEEAFDRANASVKKIEKDWRRAASAAEYIVEANLNGEELSAKDALQKVDDAASANSVLTLLRNGAIRIASNKGGLEIAGPLTDAQRDFIYDYVDWQADNNGGMSYAVDMVGRDDSGVSASYSSHTPASKIISDIEDFYENGTVPQGTVSSLAQFYEPKTDPLTRPENVQKAFDYAVENDDPSVISDAVRFNLVTGGFFEPKASLYEGLTDKALVEKAREDVGAADALYRKYNPKLMGYLRGRRVPSGAIDDVASLTWHKMLKNIASGAKWMTGGTDAFPKALLTTARRSIYDNARENRVGTELLTLDAPANRDSERTNLDNVSTDQAMADDANYAAEYVGADAGEPAEPLSVRSSVVRDVDRHLEGRTGNRIDDSRKTLAEIMRHLNGKAKVALAKILAAERTVNDNWNVKVAAAAKSAKMNAGEFKALLAKVFEAIRNKDYSALDNGALDSKAAMPEKMRDVCDLADEGLDSAKIAERLGYKTRNNVTAILRNARLRYGWIPEGEKEPGLKKAEAKVEEAAASIPTQMVMEFNEPKVSPAEDAAYRDAVKRGDMETAARMVREAAAKAMPDTKVVGEDGLPLVVYHGSQTGGSFNVFKRDGHYYFSTNKEVADAFGDSGRFSMIVNGKSVAINKDSLDFFARIILGDGHDAKDLIGRKDLANIVNSLDEESKESIYGGFESYALTGVDEYGEPEIFEDELNEFEFKENNPDYAVFLNIKNPATVNYRGKGWKQTNLTGDAVEAERSGHDGFYAKNIREGDIGIGNFGRKPLPVADDWIVFDSSQIKSADPVTYDDAGNVIPLSQRFNALSDSILYEPKTAPTDLMARNNWWREWYMKNFADRRHPILSLVKDIVKRGGTLPGRDPYYEFRTRVTGIKANLMHQIDIQQEKADALFKKHAGKITPYDVGVYLLAKATPARNAKIVARNGKLDGAGWSDADAQTALAQFAADGKLPMLQEFDPIVKSLRDNYGLDYLVNAGMLDAKTAAKLKAEEPDYVPFRTDFTSEDGFDLNSARRIEPPTLKKAYGRDDMADNPLVFLFMQARDNVSRGEENRAREAFAQLVELNPEVGVVRKQKLRGAYDFKTGKKALVADERDREKDNKNLVVVKRGGKNVYVELYGKRGAEVAEAIRGDENVYGPKLIQGIAHFWAGTATQYSPIGFRINNAIKDATEVSTSLLGDHGPAAQAKYLALRASAFANGFAATLSQYLKDGTFGGKYGNELKEWVENGGLIGGGVRQGFERIESELEEAARISKGFTKSSADAKRIIKALGDKVSYLNEMTENLSRFINFYVRRKAGEDVLPAVIASREDGTDFNMYGKQRWMNSVWMFSNSITGGTMRHARQLAKHPLMIGTPLVVLGLVEGFANALMDGGDPEEDENMTEYERANNIVIRLGNGKYVRIPLHMGPYSLMKYIGNNAARAMLGKIGWDEATANVLQNAATIATHFGPFGEISINTKGDAGDMAMSALNSFVSFGPAQTAMQLALNRDYKDARIRREHDWDKYAPNWKYAKSNTPEFFVAAARLLSNMTGGDKGEAGWLNLAPEDIKYLSEQFFKNTGKDIYQTVTTIGGAVTGAFDAMRGEDKPWDRISVNDAPVVNRMLRSVPDNARRFYEAKDFFDAKTSAMKAYESAGSIKQYEVENALGGLRTIRDAQEILKEVKKSDENWRNAQLKRDRDYYEMERRVNRERFIRIVEKAMYPNRKRK